MFPEMGKTRKKQIGVHCGGAETSGVSLDISGVTPLDKCQISSRIHSSGVQGGQEYRSMWESPVYIKMMFKALELYEDQRPCSLKCTHGLHPFFRLSIQADTFTAKPSPC